jgi:hypothetical protein
MKLNLAMVMIALASFTVLGRAQASNPCNASAGTLFNLEPVNGDSSIGFPVPQTGESIDYVPNGGTLGTDLVIETATDSRGVFDYFFSPNAPLPNAWGLSQSGYYVHRSGTDCSPSFEGGFPHMFYPDTGQLVYGAGIPVVAVDATRKAVYVTDVRCCGTVSAIGLFANTAARLNDVTACPNGTHSTDAAGNDTTASKCWPTSILFNPQRQIWPALFLDKPYIRADERASGVGAGDVYVTWTTFDFFNHGGRSEHAYIQIAACPYGFDMASNCSAPMTISANDQLSNLSQVSVRGDGTATVTYINLSFDDSGGFSRIIVDLRYVSCKPQGAPKPPVCSQPVSITTEMQPIIFSGTLVGMDPTRMPAITYPVHDSRFNGKNYEEFVVWSRCKVDPYQVTGNLVLAGCPDIDVEMSWAADTGGPLKWSSPTPVSAAPGDQILPSISTDRGRNIINIAYLSSENDLYRRRRQVMRAAINPGEYQPNPSNQLLTSAASEPNADPFLVLNFPGGETGGWMGVSARSRGTTGSRVYVGFTGHNYRGLLLGSKVAGANNLVTALDY